MKQPINNEQQEQMCVDMKCDAPRSTMDMIKAAIKEVEYREVIAFGKTITYCYLLMDDGRMINGKPALAVSNENNPPELAREIAYANAFENAWAYRGYRIHRGI